MQGISNGVEDTGGAGKVSRGSERELKSHKRETKETMWGTLSRARRSMICLPHPTAVCSNVRTRIAGPIVQVCATNVLRCPTSPFRCFSSIQGADGDLLFFMKFSLVFL